jgi:dienelactone hydrolase
MIKTDLRQEVRISAHSVVLEGSLVVPNAAQGIVLFAHGSGSSRYSPRNNFVAEVLQAGGIGTLLTDLLTKEEDLVYETRFNIELLTHRLLMVTEWVQNQKIIQGLPIGYFGASTGAAAALNAAAAAGGMVKAVVSRGGRPDLAKQKAAEVTAPVLLIVGGKDNVVIDLNRQAYELIASAKEMIIVPGASHLFEESGTLDKVASLATEWFKTYL